MHDGGFFWETGSTLMIPRGCIHLWRPRFPFSLFGVALEKEMRTQLQKEKTEAD